jgi:ribosomal-protein-alanine N-acetyltransferase
VKAAARAKRIPLPIRTPRLVIRRFEDRDVDRMHEIFGDPEVMRYIPLGVLDHGATARLLAAYNRNYDERGYSFWGIETHDGRLVGDVGFNVYAASGDPELGYTLAREAWGNGYASEAGAACIEAAFASLGAKRVLAVVDLENAASLRTAARLGMTRIDTIHPRGRPHALFERRRP